MRQQSSQTFGLFMTLAIWMINLKSRCAICAKLITHAALKGRQVQGGRPDEGAEGLRAERIRKPCSTTTFAAETGAGRRFSQLFLAEFCYTKTFVLPFDASPQHTVMHVLRFAHLRPRPWEHNLYLASIRCCSCCVLCFPSQTR